jgi:hypothetical protein
MIGIPMPRQTGCQVQGHCICPSEPVVSRDRLLPTIVGVQTCPNRHLPSPTTISARSQEMPTRLSSMHLRTAQIGMSRFDRFHSNRTTMATRSCLCGTTRWMPTWGLAFGLCCGRLRYSTSSPIPFSRSIQRCLQHGTRIRLVSKTNAFCEMWQLPLDWMTWPWQVWLQRHAPTTAQGRALRPRW